MGILNVTPDSFSDGGRHDDIASAVNHGLSLVEQGADLLDVGGESTRPGSEPVSPAEQISRTAPVIKQLADRCDAAISIDTRSAEVARAALDAGAHIVNDVSALRDDETLAELVADRAPGLVLMHMQGSPKTMQQDPHYDDVVAEVGVFLAGRATAAIEIGVPRECVVIDPGIGFGKTLEHNLALMANLPRLGEIALNLPLLVGPSRKRFIGDILDRPVDQRVAGTIGAALACMARGARILRVHDVGPVVDALAIAWRISQAAQ
jgi:dihydropteroate synthase